MRLSSKAEIGAMMYLAELGAGEHTDIIVAETCAAAIGLQIFSNCITQYVCDNQDFDSVREHNVSKEISRLTDKEIQLLKLSLDKSIGLSDKGRKRFINGVITFLTGTFAKNIQGFSVGVEHNIRHGWKSNE